MLPLDFGRSFESLKVYVHNYNNDLEELSSKIRGTTLLVAKDLLNLYGAYLIKASRIKGYDPKNPPALRTNNVQLSERVESSPRNIQRSIKRLIAANIIIHKKWRGSNSSYELLINPKILLLRCMKTMELVSDSIKNAKIQNSEIQEVKKNLWPTCPHTYQETTRNSILLLESQSRNSSQRCSQKLTSIDLPRNTARNTGEEVAKKIIDTGEEVQKRRANSKNLEVESQDEESRRTSLTFYVNSFWKLALNLLYQNVELSNWQGEQAKKHITKLFEPVETKNLQNVYEHYAFRILWQSEFNNWQSKSNDYDPNKGFILLPHQYFDTTREKGSFCGTKKPYLESLKKKHLNQVKKVTLIELRKYLNNAKLPLERQLSPLEIFSSGRQRIGKLKNGKMENFFMAAVLNPSNNTHLYK